MNCISNSLGYHNSDYTTEMAPCFEEITFLAKPPTIGDVLARLYQQTGIRVACQQQEPDSFAAVYVLTNPEDELDSLEVFYDENGQLYLAWGSPTTYLVGAALHTLVAMGGHYDSRIPNWTAKKWSEVAKKVESLPRHEHPDWVFD